MILLEYLYPQGLIIAFEDQGVWCSGKRDLFKNHILDNDKCPCGQIENAEHFLLNCPIYTELRNETIGKITMPYNIETLLKGCPLYDDNVNGEIFLAVQNFIFKSNRFE